MPRRKSPIQSKCLHCDERFEAWTSGTRYCSRSCMGKARYQASNTKTSRTCELCGTAVSNNLRSDSRFCSARCRANANARIQRIRNMGITPERYGEILASQGGSCAVTGCDITVNDNGRRLHIDHDHACCPSRWSCGACIRGLLCDRHNVALGMVRDSADELEALASYLRSTRVKAVA